MKLGGIHQHQLEIVGDLGLDANGAGQSVLDQCGKIHHQRPELQHDWLLLGAAGELQDLIQQARTAHGVVANRGEGLPNRPFGELLEQHLRRHQYRGQDVVEVMGDAARQGADVLHPLGAQALGFEIFPLRHIRVGGQDRDGLTERVAQQRVAAHHGDLVARLGEVRQFPHPVAGFEDRLPRLLALWCPGPAKQVQRALPH